LVIFIAFNFIFNGISLSNISIQNASASTEDEEFGNYVCTDMKEENKSSGEDSFANSNDNETR
jgi:hypothetical protein